MKTVLKALLPATLCAIAASANATSAPACGGHGVDSYYMNSLPGSAKVSISLAGAGATKLPNPALTGNVAVGQDFTFAADCSFTSYIYSLDETQARSNLYKITGTWSYPVESKVLYFTLDGDVSAGNNVADPEATTWGRLFAGGLSIPTVMPILFQSKVRSFGVIFPSVTVKTATIKFSPDGTKATATMSVIGKGILENTKEPSTRKEAAFSFGSVSKVTVINNPT